LRISGREAWHGRESRLLWRRVAGGFGRKGEDKLGVGSGRGGGGRLGGGGSVQGIKVFEGADLFEGFELVVPVVGFKVGALLGAEEELADVSEGGGAAGRDAVGGKGLEEAAEDVVDVNLGKVIACGAAEFFDEIVFAVEGAAPGGGVAETVAFVLGMGGHAAMPAVGEFKFAKAVEEWVGFLVAHGAYLPLA